MNLFTNVYLLSFAVSIIILSSVNVIYADDEDELVQLFNPNGVKYDHFGFSLAANGGEWLVGSPGDSTSGSGKIHYGIPSRNEILNPSTGINFGVAVDLDDDYLVTVTRDGKLYVYLYDQENDYYPNVLLLHSIDLPAIQIQYFSLVINGDKIFVGAPDETTNIDKNKSGVVYVYDIHAGRLIDTIHNPAPYQYDRFGYSIDSYGSLVVIGAPSNFLAEPSEYSYKTGSAYVFTTDGDLKYALHNSLHNNEHVGFGEDVAINSKYVAIGAPHNDFWEGEIGKTYLYDLDGNLYHTFDRPTDDTWHFGATIVMDEKYLVIAAPSYLRTESNGDRITGVVYVYLLDTFEIVYTIKNTFDFETGFGDSLAIGQDVGSKGLYHYLLIGAPYYQEEDAEASPYPVTDIYRGGIYYLFFIHDTVN